MADTRSPEQRRNIMRSVSTKDTGPEIVVRRLLHRMGLRFRLHRADLPGKPDVVLPKYKAAIFVHGCFWHAHGCKKGQPPKSREEYWGPKLRRNQERDAAAMKALQAAGWHATVVWQCELRDEPALEARLRSEVKLPPEKSIDSDPESG